LRRVIAQMRGKRLLDEPNFAVDVSEAIPPEMVSQWSPAASMGQAVQLVPLKHNNLIKKCRFCVFNSKFMC
jgi:hypothetical protein